MRKVLFSLGMTSFLLSCNDKATTASADTASKDSSATTTTIDLPYKASYSSSWSDDVSDADLKMVLTTYKDWADSNMTGLVSSLADTVEVDFPSGDHFKDSKTELMKRWAAFRDSLSSVVIDMQGWNKMYSTDKKEGYIVTWYKETDNYKNGKADSAYYHDINQVKDGKIVWYSQYKRPKK
jgi:hypothetical protein